MFAYFKGAGTSAFVATLLTTFIFFGLAPESFGHSLHGYFVILTFILTFNYVGCIFGWILLYFIRKNISIDIEIAIMFYIFLGCMFMIIPFSLFSGHGSLFTLGAFLFTFISIIGSVTFYLAQRIKNRLLSWSAILFGPSALLISCYNYWYVK